MFEVKKFIETSTENEFINIDYIVSIKKGLYGYYVTTCDGNSYELGDFKEAENLFEYLKKQTVAKFKPTNRVYE